MKLPDAKGDRLVQSTFALLVSNASGALLGVVFWAVADRLYSTQDVGNGVAEVAAMTFCANIGLLNLGTIFPRFLYPAGVRAGTLVRRGYAASISVALVAALVYLGFVGHPRWMSGGLIPRLFFVEAVLLWVVFTIEDAALVGLRRPFLVPFENSSFSLIKIALLPIFLVVAPVAGVFDAWVLPVGLCVAGVSYFLFGYALPHHIDQAGSSGVLPGRRVLTRVLAAEYMGGLAFAALWQLPPALLVYNELGPRGDAYFQTPWIAATSFDLLLFSFATSLIVEATSRPTAAPASVRKAVRLALLVMVPAMVVLIVAAPLLLAVLGRKFEQEGTWLLRYVALALPFMGVNVLYVTFARLARRARRVFIVQWATSALILSLIAALLPSLGIPGVGVAFLCGQAAMCAVLLPSVVRQFRRHDMAPSFAIGASLVVQDGEVPVDLAGPELGLALTAEQVEVIEALEPPPGGPGSPS